ncbi:MAG: hybrid sensor histidine kinase/response regulator [Polyangiales bacterium]
MGESTAPASALWGDDLAEREELLREAERIAQVGSWAWDMRTGSVAWSDEMYRLLGLSPESEPATYERFIASVHPDDRGAVNELAERASMGDVATYADYRVVRPDGAIRWVTGIAQIFRDDQGVPRRMVGVALDVTERKRLETELGRAQKLEALGRLVGGVAHDFNNLLTVILLNVAAVKRTGAREEDERVTNAYVAATQAAELTSQLLAFSRHSVRRDVAVDLNAAVANTMQLVGRLLDESIRTHFTPFDGPTVVRADATQLAQIVLNLAVNARDAMPRGGELTIETTVVSRDDTPFVRLDVRDTGTGMDEATRARLFEPFFTTKEPGRGTGLGLATVFGIVSQSGGRVEVESALGKGSTFSVLLPLVDGAEEPQNQAPTPPKPRHRGQVVLLVEDDAGVRAVIDGVLRSDGYEVVPAATPAEAMTRWASERDRIAVLVSDVVMPGKSGHELLARLRDDRPSLPALFVSGYDPMGSLDPSVRCLRKPFTREELLEALDAALS